MKDVLGAENAVRELPPALASAMLSTVMAWATVDGAISQLYATVCGLDDVEHADQISEMPAQLKLHQIIKVLRPEAADLAKALRGAKKRYERYSKTRNTIAHCHYHGHPADESDRAIFLVYQRFEDGLAVDGIHISQFRKAAEFGHRFATAIAMFDQTLREELELHSAPKS